MTMTLPKVTDEMRRIVEAWRARYAEPLTNAHMADAAITLEASMLAAIADGYNAAHADWWRDVIPVVARAIPRVGEAMFAAAMKNDTALLDRLTDELRAFDPRTTTIRQMAEASAEAVRGGRGLAGARAAIANAAPDAGTRASVLAGFDAGTSGPRTKKSTS